MKLIFLIPISVIGYLIGYILEYILYRVVKREASDADIPENLSAVKLLDILSNINVRRGIRTAVKLKYPFVQLFTVLAYILLYLKFSMSVEFLASAYMASILIMIFFIDINYKIIPHSLIISGLIGGALIFIYNLFIPFKVFDDRSWWNPLVGMISGSGVLLIVAVIGIILLKTDDAMGIGDVKLFAPIGLFLGWKLALISLALTVVIAGISGVALLIVKAKGRKSTIAYGPFIVIGSLVSLLWGHELLRLYLLHVAGISI